MKYIKTQENFIKSFIDSLGKPPVTVQISNAIDKFLNTIEPELKCYTKNNWIISKDNEKLAYFEYYNNSVEITMFYKPELIKFFKFILPEAKYMIRNNCHRNYGNEEIGVDCNGTSIDIPKSTTSSFFIPSFIKNLTIDNYNKYLIQQKIEQEENELIDDTNKYNL